MYVIFQSMVGAVAVRCMNPKSAIDRAEQTLAIMFPDIDFELSSTSEQYTGCLTYPCKVGE